MTNFQRAVCVLLSLCFFAVLAVTPEPFFPWENVYRQLPLYCFLEKEARSISQREDPETSERIVADNAAYLGTLVQKENQAPESALTQTPSSQKEDKPKEQSPTEPENNSPNTSLLESTDQNTIDKNPTAKNSTNNTTANQEPTASNFAGEEVIDGKSMGEERIDGKSMGEERIDGESVGEEAIDRESKGEERIDGESVGEEKIDGEAAIDGLPGEEENTDASIDDAPAQEEHTDSASAGEEFTDNASDGEETNSGAPAGEGRIDNDSTGEENTGSGNISDESDEPGLEIESTEAAHTASVQQQPIVDLSPEVLSDYDYVVNQFFILDPNTATNPDQINASNFLEKDLTMEKKNSGPQILIYHSHSQETFADSREGEPEDTVVGVGNYLTELLTETYGYQVLHITETFDIIDGEVDRSKAYDYAREYLEQILTENPSIEVIIDLHRDGVPEDRHLVTEINGKETAQIMFYNGLSYTVNNGPVDYLPNPYIQDNLAFSFQLEYQAALYYPELYRGIYLAGLRYNLHLRPRALLLEAGAQTNTVQEVKNAMEPFADILNRVLTGA